MADDYSKNENQKAGLRLIYDLFLRDFYGLCGMNLSERKFVR